ncbi:MAG: hypothetical protein LC751_15465 [Actinobacteria bacterium]|nr:hypothetical protein [Actinomycetota bacterium]MCA1738913.1 hypothetical protein [Actinomycetota bacterium]
MRFLIALGDARYMLLAVARDVTTHEAFARVRGSGRGMIALGLISVGALS